MSLILQGAKETHDIEKFLLGKPEICKKKLVKSPVVIVLAFVVVVVVVEEVGCEAAGVMDALLLEDVD